MTSTQKPIGSGFGAASTAREVLDGLDLTGRFAIVTGGYSGVGLEDVRALAAAGATVLVPARRPVQARQELARMEQVEVERLDLSDLDSVRAFAERFLKRGRSVDYLINCAGVMAPPLTRVGLGWELQFATNHLGHFALTNLLWPAIVADGGARIVSFSSRGHKFSDIRWDDPHFERGYDRWQAYGQSKTANILFALHLDKLAEPFGVRAFSLNPGGIRTNLQRYVEPADQVALGWVDQDGNDLIQWKSAPAGAATAAWAATAPALDGMGGVYLEDCEVAEIVDPQAPDAMRRGLHPWGADPQSAARLWTMSAELTGINAF
ncbi:oxidoreductase [Actinacidiphila acididurans]|uniref:SDR family NAD(P)-dependent oxidoreductase n=1 Tax=Actinacidiphila acididurans TaxID=2784346 RepID=A0ABS2TJB7_9ACTN|nr:oxidoreductase [Actinacidiphila acididurans]MBM9503440.1 SDR family NAD(P)-dependent oxidoreductase [Actinacidiphila acididurans]